MPTETILLVLVLLAGFYMAWNIGANDVANAVGTSVGSGALLLKQAVILAAILEFSGAFFFGSHVSTTVQQGVVDPEVFQEAPRILVYGMLSTLIAAGAWLQIASYFGWPVSTTHSIIGSLVGFGAVVGGLNAVYWGNVAYIFSSWILSPLCGGALGYFAFDMLRRKIFYAHDPVAATKRIAPFLVFLLTGILALVMLFQGLQNLHLQLNFLQACGIAAVIGAIGAIVTYLLLRGVATTPPSPETGAPILDSSGIIALDKAKKHLKRLEASADGETKRRASMVLDEVRSLSRTVKASTEAKIASTEFAAVEKIFGYMQIMSACLMAFAHGANDVANAIGPLSAAVTILRSGTVAFQNSIPTWALTLGGIGIIFGLATWGWRVIETVGRKITELTPTRGFAAEFGAATTILVASRLGMPISTTHTLVGAVIGVGLARGMEALNLATTRDIVISWIITVPAGALIAVTFYYILLGVFG